MCCRTRCHTDASFHPCWRDVAIDGYRIDVECDEQSLRVRAKNNAARAALTGKAHGDGALVIPQSTIVDVKFKAARMFVKGKLSVRTTDGHKYRMHFRKRQQGDFERLAQQLDAALWQRFHDAATFPMTNADPQTPIQGVGS
jgi:hypothetical protein